MIPPAPRVHPLTAVYNRAAIVPAMCYTRTEGRYNPCYVCHQNSLPGRENTMNDGDLQEAYSFSEVGMTNHWQNLRTGAVIDGPATKALRVYGVREVEGSIQVQA